MYLSSYQNPNDDPTDVLEPVFPGTFLRARAIDLMPMIDHEFSLDGKFIVTAYRDFKIRVTVFPKKPLDGAHEIQLLPWPYRDRLQGYLVSGSGDYTLKKKNNGGLLLDYTSGLLLHTCEVGSQIAKAGGNFAWAAQPVYKHKPLLEEQWEEMTNLKTLYRNLLKKEGYIAIWQKPLKNNCYLNHEPETIPPLYDERDDTDDVWAPILVSEDHRTASVHHRKAIIGFLDELDINELPLLFDLLIKPLQTGSSGVDDMDESRETSVLRH
ncbi:probable methyltransferase PMT11 [Tanacetum coccineum]